MKTQLSLLCSVVALTGCLASAPPAQSPSGQAVKFMAPILGKGNMTDARYVLIEKSIADGKYQVISMSRTRQPITNDRQERIAFTKDLTRFAPDYTDYSFQTYTDNGNYGEQTVVMNCQVIPLKTQEYGPCNSAFGELFIPTGVIKAHAAGQMNSATKRTWDDPQQNRLRYVRTPEYVLKQAGVFNRLSELANAN